MSTSLNSTYWNKRYLEQRVGWDLGVPSTPLKAYIDTLTDPSMRILIPGGGNAYEAEYLFKKGFKNVFVVDLAPEAKANFKRRCPDFPENQFWVQDFFEVNDHFDLILEQTFFCALHPSQRSAYAQKVAQLLTPTGTIAGLFFDFPLIDGPPFGGSKTEYETYFKPDFRLSVLERSYNSIPERQGKELFFIFQPKAKE